MRKYNIPPAFSGSLQLGRQGENGATEITFLCAGYAKMYGDGFAELVHKAPDGTIYPVNIEQDESNRVNWLISDGDTTTAGNGELELRWMVNGNLAKSKTFETIVQKTLTVPENPPEAAKSWVDKVLQAAEDIKAGAIDDEKLAKAIAEYLEKHPIESSGITEAKAQEIAQSVVDGFEEKDPTVPDWAKAETKPTYTASEVGAVPESAKSDIDKNTAARHTHENKSALDIITADDISKWNSETAGTVEIAGATALESGNAPTVTETAGSTERARKYLLGIPKGEKGDAGAQGTDGKSAYQFAQDGGYTGTESDFIQKLNKETFANPYPLIFTGATSATYDGSESVTVNLPTGNDKSYFDETVTLDETVNGELVFTEMNGKPIKLTSCVVLAKLNHDNQGTNIVNGRICSDIDSEYVTVKSLGLPAGQEYDRPAFIFMHVVGNFAYVEASEMNTTEDITLPGVVVSGSKGNGQVGRLTLNNPFISKIKLSGHGTISFGAGTKIRIVGVYE